MLSVFTWIIFALNPLFDYLFEQCYVLDCTERVLDGAAAQRQTQRQLASLVAWQLFVCRQEVRMREKVRAVCCARDFTCPLGDCFSCCVCVCVCHAFVPPSSSFTLSIFLLCAVLHHLADAPCHNSPVRPFPLLPVAANWSCSLTFAKRVTDNDWMLRVWLLNSLKWQGNIRVVVDTSSRLVATAVSAHLNLWIFSRGGKQKWRN